MRIKTSGAVPVFGYLKNSAGVAETVGYFKFSNIKCKVSIDSLDIYMHYFTKISSNFDSKLGA